MIIKKITLKDVKCFDEGEVEFAPGKNVIVGRNGSGKSTLLQSVLYSLYGHYPLGNNDDLIRLGKNTAEFHLSFEHNKQGYIVERKIGPSGSDAFLWEEGREDPIAEKQTFVTEEISSKLGIHRDIFKDIILVGQGEIAEIIGMTGGDRKKLFDRLLGLHDYDLAHSKCRRIINQIENKIEKAQEVISAHKETAEYLDERKAELEEHKQLLEDTEEALKECQDALEEDQPRLTNLEEIKSEISEVKIVIEQREESIGQYERKTTEANAQISRLCEDLGEAYPTDVSISNIEELLRDAELSKTETKSNLEEARNAHQELLEMKTELEGLETRIPSEQEELDEIEEDFQDTATSILYVVPDLEELCLDDWGEVIESKLANIRREIEKSNGILDRIRQLESDLNSERRLKDEKDRTIGNIESQIEKTSEDATKEIGEKWMEIAKTDLRSISAKIRSLEKQIKEKTDSEKAVLGKKASIEMKIKTLEEDMDNLSGLKGKKCPKCKQTVDDEHAMELEEELRDKIESSEGSLNAVKLELQDIISRLSQLKTDLEESEEKRDRVHKARDYLERHESHITELEKEQKKLETIEKKITAIKQELEGFDKELIRDNSEKQDERKDELMKCVEKSKSLQGITKQLESKWIGIGDLRQRFRDLSAKKPKAKIDELVVEISELEDALNKWSKVCSKLETHLDNLTSLSNSVAEKRKDSQKLAKLESEFDPTEYTELSEKVSDLRDEKTTFTERIRGLKDDQIPAKQKLYDDSKRAHEQMQKVGKEEIKNQMTLKIMKKVRKFYREVQKPLRRRDTRRASRHATDIFKTIIGSSEFDRIHISQEHELQISRSGTLEPMSRLSGGEQVLAGLSVRLGFARALASSDLLLLDEPTAYLDDQRRAELVETLNRINPANQILIVTHDEEFERVAQKVIHVRKDEDMLSSSIDS